MKEKKSNVITTSDLKTNYLKTNLLKQIKKYFFFYEMQNLFANGFSPFDVAKLGSL